MFRGRRVGMLAVCFWLFLHILAVDITAQEYSIAVSAKVLLSKEWADSIAKNTLVSLDGKEIYLGKKINITITPKGLPNATLDPQKIQVLIFLGDTLLSSDELTNDNSKAIKTSFTPNDFGQYRILFIDTTYQERIFSLDKQINFSIP